MKLRWVVTLASIAALPAAAGYAQSCPKEGVAHNNGSFSGGNATSFYYEAEGNWVNANAEEGFAIIDLGMEGPIRFPLDSGLRIQADKRTRLRGIKDARIEDFQRGDRVSVKFHSVDGTVVRLKLKRPPKS